MSGGNENSFVLFPLGSRKFALPAEKVTELAKPDLLQTFPHCTRLLTGVLTRRGRIVPVCDVAQVLVGPDTPPRKFYLIANRKFESRLEWTASPVSGECELASGEPVAPGGRQPEYITGLLSLNDEMIEVLDLERLIAMEAGA